jgi:hypothetical protein
VPFSASILPSANIAFGYCEDLQDLQVSTCFSCFFSLISLQLSLSEGFLNSLELGHCVSWSWRYNHLSFQVRKTGTNSVSSIRIHIVPDKLRLPFMLVSLGLTGIFGQSNSALCSAIVNGLRWGTGQIGPVTDPWQWSPEDRQGFIHMRMRMMSAVFLLVDSQCRVQRRKDHSARKPTSVRTNPS